MISKRSRWATMVFVCVAGLACISAGEREQVFQGEIGDSQCAFNVHSLSRSHAEMMKRRDVGTTLADCARYCVKYFGGVFVLQVKNKVYKLDDQQLAEKHAGEKAKVTGVLDPKTNTIAVHSIEAIK